LCFSSFWGNNGIQVVGACRLDLVDHRLPGSDPLNLSLFRQIEHPRRHVVAFPFVAVDQSGWLNPCRSLSPLLPVKALAQDRILLPADGTDNQAPNTTPDHHRRAVQEMPIKQTLPPTQQSPTRSQPETEPSISPHVCPQVASPASHSHVTRHSDHVRKTPPPPAQSPLWAVRWHRSPTTAPADRCPAC
jgi:hypothetical protein